MTQLYDGPTLFDALPDGSFDLHTPEPVLVIPDEPVLNGHVETGLYVDIADRQAHITDTYVALSKLALASRDEAATTKPTAIGRITVQQGPKAGSYLAAVAQRAKDLKLEARSLYMNSVQGEIPESEVDPRLGGWYRFRTTYGGPKGQPARDQYRDELAGYARNFGYTLPETEEL